MELHGQARGPIKNARVGRHPGPKNAHSSTAKAVVSCCRNELRLLEIDLLDHRIRVTSSQMGQTVSAKSESYET